MRSRIFGVETEFGLRFAPDGLGQLAPEEAARVLFRPVVEWGRSSNVFLGNGARLYLDVGSHPEYATAECASLTDLVRQDKAGERIFEDLAEQAEDALALRDRPGRLHLFKNNVDSAGNSYGSHENYLISRRVEFPRLVRHLVPFLVTRQLVVGAGRLHPPGSAAAVQAGREGGSYSFSQRADHVWEAASSATTRSRPLINTRDEPHADPSAYRRLHVIVGDSNMSETTLLARAGMTDLMLRMIEHRVGLPDLQLRHPGQALRAVSHDPTGAAEVELADGRRLSGLQLQRICLEAAADFLDAQGSDRPETDVVMDLWERTLEAIETQDISGIDTEIDWAIKRRLMERVSRGHGLDPADPRLAQVDLAYHDINRSRGLFHLLQRRGLTRRWVTEEQIAQSIAEGPRTRARVRGGFIRAAREAGQDFTVDWVHLKINQRPDLSHVCQDPFAASDPAVEETVRTLVGRRAPADPPEDQAGVPLV
ncbi:Pup--protein ligase [Rothia kristinae]|uniref:Pup--protein ligase n=1 Tax=Rothia kristinae TaxID=37923 RepID=A0A7T3F733_9MICC|nr:Pup--protein ligase [Rothia kristinae]TDP57068.1 proteasome accessory factor A [Kocuria sp. AG109]SIM45494.1 Pup--protein ligase [Mycobacteroides abscessus subsp. abscessus]KTR35132.1 Pup--protein ligase [Rothia kristinae]KTR59372.1 Pup--protein ligase [Rothia kristinae]KTR63224.1 Pup--protein ligase [Rothia kristinae]